MRHKATALQDIREIVEEKLAQMLARNPSRMDYQQRYEEIVADYNREKKRVMIEETFRRLTKLIEDLDAEQRRAVEEGLSEDELAVFDLLKKENLAKIERECVKQASRGLACVNQGALGEARPVLGEGADQSRCGGFSSSTRSIAACRHPRSRRKRRKQLLRRSMALSWQQAVSGEFAMAALRQARSISQLGVETRRVGDSLIVDELRVRKPRGTRCSGPQGV